MKRFLQHLRDLLFPPRCAACGELLDWHRVQTEPTYSLCKACSKEWEAARVNCCSYCSMRVGHCSCVTAEQKRAHIKAFYKLVYYDDKRKDAVQNRIIYGIKRAWVARTDAWLSELLFPAVEEIRRNAPNAELVLIHLPRRRKARVKQGVDQAEMLAAALSQKTNIPHLHLLKRRFGNQPEQKHLRQKERIQIAKKSYRLCKSAKGMLLGKTVLLLDDIVTTGASVSACAALLLQAGAKDVICIAVASDAVNAAPM